MNSYTMGSIKVSLISEGKNAFSHPDFSKGAIAQKLQIKYGIEHIENLEIPNGDFEIEIDVDKNENGIDWDKFEFPNDTISDQIKEIIYFTKVKTG